MVAKYCSCKNSALMMHCLLYNEKNIIWVKTECKPEELEISESYKQHLHETFISRTSSCLLCSSITFLLFLLALINVQEEV